MTGTVLSRLLAGVAALAAGSGAVVAAGLLLRDAPRPVASTPAAAAASPVASPVATRPLPPGFPAPPPSAIVFSRQDGADALALGVVPHRASVLLQASVLDGAGHGLRGLAVSFAVRGIHETGKRVRAAPCGAGCYRATLPTVGAPAAVDVTVAGGSAATRWHVPLSAVWPAPDASALMARAGTVWRTLRSLAFDERIASDTVHAVTSHWRVEAPDRAAYQVVGGYAGIVIGGRRWDRAAGGRWRESPQTVTITQPVPLWTAAENARLLGHDVVDGRRVSIVSFFDPGSPAWFQVMVDERTFRTLDLRMVTTAHFMHDTYRGFDRTPAIVPPR